MPKALSGLMGMRHVALNVTDVERSKAFYQDVLGMEVVWQPDPGNVYLSSGADNLALHQLPDGQAPAAAASSLDHLGFIVSHMDRVQELEREFRARDVAILKPFKRHRDGSASFYCADPDGVVIQMLYEPTLSKQAVGESEDSKTRSKPCAI